MVGGRGQQAALACHCSKQFSPKLSGGGARWYAGGAAAAATAAARLRRPARQQELRGRQGACLFKRQQLPLQGRRTLRGGRRTRPGRRRRQRCKARLVAGAGQEGLASWQPCWLSRLRLGQLCLWVTWSVGAEIRSSSVPSAAALLSTVGVARVPCKRVLWCGQAQICAQANRAAVPHPQLALLGACAQRLCCDLLHTLCQHLQKGGEGERCRGLRAKRGMARGAGTRDAECGRGP